MPIVARITSLLRNFSRRRYVEKELTDEVDSYVEMLTQEKMKEGLSEQEARRAALVDLGGPEQVKEAVRANRTGFGLETFVQDLRYGARSLLKNPGFTLTAVIALALGIGANTAIFSVIDGVLLRSLSYPDPENIVMLWEQNSAANRKQNVVSPGNFLDWQKQSTSFQEMAAVWDTRANLTGGGEPEEIQAQRVTAAFWSVLGVQPALGRFFAEEEDRPSGDLVVILSYRLWQGRFGGNPAILGQPAKISGRTYTVIGVMPPDFHLLNNQVQAWLPLALDPAIDYRTSGRYLRCLARLKPGVTTEQAQAELNGIAKQLQQSHPQYNAGWGVNLVPMHEQVVGEIRPILMVLLTAVAFVLLIACANVANLLLSRATARRKELALRAALGASRLRLVRQMLTESVLLAVTGGVLGIFLAYWGIQVLIGFGPDNIPRLNEITIDPRVLVFTFAVSLLAGVIFGLVPAIQASRPDLTDALKQGTRGSTGGRRSSFRNLFVVAEVSLALVLLIGAGLMIRSFQRLQQVRTGFNADSVLTMRVQLPTAKYKESQQRENFFKQAQERIGALPGVKSVGAINFLPLTGSGSSTIFAFAGRPEPPAGEAPGTQVRVITPSYFATMGIPLLKGRLLDERDGSESRVLLINETFARRYFPGEDPIGKRIVLNWQPKVADEIVGVVGDIKDVALEAEPNPAIYWPHPREPYQFMNLILRTSTDPTAMASTAQKEIRVIDPDQPIAEVRTMEEVVAKSIARPRFNTLLLGIFAAVALVLASVGIYGVMNYSATQRTHEIGIRMTLGAERGDIMRLVVGQGMRLAVLGIAIGVLASWGLTRVMASLLFGVTATDGVTFIAVSAVFAAVAFIANYIPARRATRLNPVMALRYE